MPAFDPEDEFETVTIAVIDTEIDVNHPELSEKMLSGWDFYNNSDTVFVGGDSPHGTQISSVIGAAIDGEGIAGVA